MTPTAVRDAASGGGLADIRYPADTRRSLAVREDRGSGTVLSLALCALLCVGLLTTGLLTSAAAARHRAQSAADLAALAAADVALGRRPGDACTLAAQVAGSNGGRLTTCALADDGTVLVEVHVTPSGPAEVLGPARVRARAGPDPSAP